MRRVFPIAWVCLASFAATAQSTTPVPTPYWRVSFVDDFRGRPDNSARSVYCYDRLKPQCHVWAGVGTHNCDQQAVVGVGTFPPVRENMVVAINTVDPGPWAQKDEATIRARYSKLVADNLRELDKCTWTLYDQMNIWSADAEGRHTSRFDGSQVKVEKGRLILSATGVPGIQDCVYGGRKSGPNCLVHAFGPNEVKPNVTYWVDANPRWPGVYYAKGPAGDCPHGGAAGANCQVRAFSPEEVEEGVRYWIDANPAWPGVYYLNDTQYRCAPHHVYLDQGVRHRKIICHVLNGGVMSSRFTYVPVDPNTGKSAVHGRVQRRGRFEVKARIPKALGSFPAAWLLPQSGGWPYPGGEIDIMEARGDAREVHQTYHHGKCFTTGPFKEHIVEGSGRCAGIPGAKSIQISYGKTERERKLDEFSLRDHVFAVEWFGERLDYYINNVRIRTVEPGTPATHAALGNPDNIYSWIDLGKADAVEFPPAALTFASSNFPSSPFYWILNHSADRRLTPGSSQTFSIDWVRNYESCSTEAQFCPCGGTFRENVGCVVPPGVALQCPAGMQQPVLSGNVYPSDCRPVRHDCVNGGRVAGLNCQVHQFDNPEVVKGVEYWVETDPRWPGVYYAPVNWQCPYGGSVGANCQLKPLSVPAVYVTPDVQYWVDTTWPGVYYALVGGECPYGGSKGANCQLVAFPPKTITPGRKYWVDTNPRSPGVYYDAPCNTGDAPVGPNCRLMKFDNPQVVRGVKYWVDTDPRWPGVYYAPDANGQCPFGGSQGANCQVLAFKNPAAYVVPGVKYWVDSNPAWPGVYYAPDGNGHCLYGGSKGANCQVIAFGADILEPGVSYWIETDPRWPGVYYAPDFR